MNENKMNDVSRVYVPAIECKNKDVIYTCHKCGVCGRVFNDAGVMIHPGLTHPDYDDEE